MKEKKRKEIKRNCIDLNEKTMNRKKNVMYIYPGARSSYYAEPLIKLDWYSRVSRCSSNVKFAATIYKMSGSVEYE